MSPASSASAATYGSKRATSRDRAAHRVQRELAFGGEQGELLHLLVRREQVAFDAVGEVLEHLARRALLLAREALLQPGGQRGARHGLDFDDHAGPVERGEPRRLHQPPPSGRGMVRSSSVSGFGRAHQSTIAAAACASGLPLASLSSTIFFAEERKAGAGVGELAPVERARGLEHLALGEAALARRGAHRVGGLEHEQRLIAEDRVDRGEILRQMAGKLFRLSQPHYC